MAELWEQIHRVARVIEQGAIDLATLDRSDEDYLEDFQVHVRTPLREANEKLQRLMFEIEEKV